MTKIAPGTMSSLNETHLSSAALASQTNWMSVHQEVEFAEKFGPPVADDRERLLSDVPLLFGDLLGIKRDWGNRRRRSGSDRCTLGAAHRSSQFRQEAYVGGIEPKATRVKSSNQHGGLLQVCPEHHRWVYRQAPVVG